MGYKLMEQNGNTQYGCDSYAVDAVADLKNLPKQSGMGSTALIISTGDVYMKNSKGEWVKL